MRPDPPKVRTGRPAYLSLSSIMTQRKTWQEPAQLRRAIDGDTIEVLLDTGYGQRLVQTVRLKDVDTTEIYGVPHDSDEYEKGMRQKRFVEEWLTVPGEFPLAVETYERGKYGGRWVGRIYKNGEWNTNNYVNAESLSNALIAEWPEVEE